MTGTAIIGKKYADIYLDNGDFLPNSLLKESYF